MSVIYSAKVSKCMKIRIMGVPLVIRTRKSFLKLINKLINYFSIIGPPRDHFL
jgi:hypothetical protein